MLWETCYTHRKPGYKPHPKKPKRKAIRREEREAKALKKAMANGSRKVHSYYDANDQLVYYLDTRSRKTWR